MHEIDSQSGDPLSKALRQLAASSDQNAPAEVCNGLMTAFRQHHKRGRRIHRIRIAAMALCLALLTAIPLLRHLSERHPSGPIHTLSNATSRSSASSQVADLLPIKSQPYGKRSAPQKAAKKTTPQTALNRPFLALPAYDPLVPKDQLRVVRVKLPANELWQIGAPVSMGSGTQSMTADFVLSQDGTPYAVRLVP